MLKIVGDVNFSDGYFDVGFGTGSKIKKGQNPFGHLKRVSKDFWIGNFECVCSSLVNEQPFVVSPDVLDNIRLLDLFGVANNHAMQHGEEAYKEMLQYLKGRDVRYVGSKDCKSVRFEHQEKRIGVLAFSQRPDNFTENPLYWSMPEYRDVEKEVEVLTDCDFRIAYIHWGNEFVNYPYIDQKQFGHFLVDCGVDLVIGMHPHVAQGYEIYNGKHIFYSLGNFVFYMPWEPTKYSLVVNVNFENGVEITTEYVKIGEDGFPRIVESVPEIYSMDYLNKLIAINEENEKYYRNVFRCYKSYRKVNRRQILFDFLRMENKYRVSVIKNFIRRRLN